MVSPIEMFEDEPLKIRIGTHIFKFRDPNDWTVGEVCNVEDASTSYATGLPMIDSLKLMSKTIARVVMNEDGTPIAEGKVSAMPYNVIKPLFEIVRWRQVPLGN